MNVPLTFQRTLMPRDTMDQAIVTGLSIAANHALGLARAGVDPVGCAPRARRREDARATTSTTGAWSQATIALDLVAAGCRASRIQRGLRQRHREPLPRAGARTGGFVLAASGGAGAIIGVLQEVFVFSRGKTRGHGADGRTRRERARGRGRVPAPAGRAPRHRPPAAGRGRVAGQGPRARCAGDRRGVVDGARRTGPRRHGRQGRRPRPAGQPRVAPSARPRDGDARA